MKTPADIYTLTESDLSLLEGFKEKSIQNLLHAIESSKEVPLSRFIMALGIKHVGSGTAEMLAEEFGSIDPFLHATKEQLLHIEGIGEKVAQSIIEFIHDPDARKEVDRLLENGVTPQRATKTKSYHANFSGKLFVITGTLQKYSRSEAAALIKMYGGKVSESVSKKTDFLVAGESAGSKYEKALSLGIPILDEMAFLQLIKKE